MVHYCFTPFTHFPIMFLSLSNPVPFVYLPSFHPPTYFIPSDQVNVPCPCLSPFFQSPSYLPPFGKIKEPIPCGLPSRTTPLYFGFFLHLRTFSTRNRSNSHKDKGHRFPLQLQEKKKEGLRKILLAVSPGFLLVVIGGLNVYHDLL